MPLVHVGNVDLYYELHGEGSTLLMINGLGSSVEMWSPFWKRLAERHRVVLFDNVGVGRSTLPEGPLTIRAMAQHTAGLLDVLDIHSTYVYGASMGGMIAQQLALDYPQRVRALVLGMTTCGGPHSILPGPDTMARMAKVGSPPPGTSVAEVLWSLVYTPEFLEAHRTELAREAGAIRFPTTTQGYRLQAEAAMAFNVYDRLPEVRAPTLVMAGSRDALMPPGNAEIIASRIPGAHLRVFEGAAHAFTREREEESAEAILGFLDSVEKS